MKPTLGYVISKKRKELNISQRELSKQINIANSTISRIEMNRITQPDSSTLQRISSYLSLDYNYLLALAGHIKNEPEIRLIQRAIKFMPQEKKDEMMALLASKYPEYFSANE